MIANDLRASAAHVFVADVGSPELGPEDDHHLRRVLRLRSGERITVTDGAGGWAPARWTGGSASAVELCGAAVFDLVPRPELGVAVAAVSGGADRIDWAVQKLTELGIDQVVVFVADRSGVRWDTDRLAKLEARHQRQAQEAAMQSRRTTLPQVSIAASTAGAIAHLSANFAYHLRADFDAPSLQALLRDGDCFGPSHNDVGLGDDRVPRVFVGPPGGWSEAESALIPRSCSVGSTVLRTETAALVVATLLVAHREATDQSLPTSDTAAELEPLTGNG